MYMVACIQKHLSARVPKTFLMGKKVKNSSSGARRAGEACPPEMGM